MRLAERPYDLKLDSALPRRPAACPHVARKKPPASSAVAPWPGPEQQRGSLRYVAVMEGQLTAGQVAADQQVVPGVTVAAFCSVRARLALARVTGRRAALGRRLR